MRYGVAVLAALAPALAPAGAGAATRYVSPAGVGRGTCVRAAPCSVAWALDGDGSNTGDTVIVLGGTYTDQAVSLTKRLVIAGREDRARPVFNTTSGDGAALTVGPGADGSVVRHLSIESSTPAAPAVDVLSAASLSDLQVTSATTACLRSSARGLHIDDSSFVQTGTAQEPCLQSSGDDGAWTGVVARAPGGPAAARFAGNGRITDATFTAQGTGLRMTGSAIAHRVTAIGGARGVELDGATTLTDSVAVAGNGGSAILAGGGGGEGAGAGGQRLLHVTAWATGDGSIGIRAGSGSDVAVTDAIARGEAADLSVDAGSPANTADCPADTGCPAGRMSAAYTNFRTGEGIVDGGANQSGDPRFVDSAGLDFHLRPDSPAIDSGSLGLSNSSADRDDRYRWLGKAPDLGAYEYRAPRARRPRADVVAPRLTGVRLAPRRFRTARRGLAFSASGGAPAGATLSFSLSEPADLVLLISPARPRGGALGAIVERFASGRHRMRISGMLERRPLRPGRYVLTTVARDLSQNLSRPQRFTLIVTR